MKIIVRAFLAGVLWQENKSMWAGEKASRMAAEEFERDSHLSYLESQSRKDFELMAAVKYPGALALGRHSIHRTYKNANLEKRWKGWLLCDQYRHGINPEEEV